MVSASNLNNQAKQSKNMCLDAISKELCDSRLINNVLVPHNVVQSTIKQSEKVFPWITHNVINKSFKNTMQV